MAPTVRAEDGGSSFVISDIRVEGLQRMDASTVFQNLGVSVGDELSPELSADLLRNLYATGLFRDIRLERDESVLVVKITENPTIAEVNLVGVDEFDSDQLLEQLKAVGIGESLVMPRDVPARVSTLLRDIYSTRAYYSVSVVPTTTPLSRNRVGLTFEVSEGTQAKVGSIRILGAQEFDEDELIEDFFQLKPSGLSTLFGDDDVFTAEQLNADVETLRNHYLSEGFIRFSILSSDVALSADKRKLHIVVAINEGSRYTVSGYELIGNNKILSEEEIADAIAFETGDIYSEAKVTETSGRLSSLLSDRSYAFANISVDREIDDESGEVKVLFEVDTGVSVNIGRIEISGNYETRDEVIRRELLQFEREPYSESKIQRSLRRLRRLGYFDSVDIKTVPTTEDGSQTDLEVEVSEGNTGSISTGAGYSSSGGLILRIGFSQSNIFGTGNDFSFVASRSSTEDKYSMGFDEAYVTDDGISRHIEFATEKKDTEDDQVDYNIDGILFRYGYSIPVLEDVALNTQLEYTDDEINNVGSLSNLDAEARRFVCRYGKCQTTTPADDDDMDDMDTDSMDMMDSMTTTTAAATTDSKDFRVKTLLLKGSLIRDTRDQTLNTKSGFRQRVAAEITTPVWDMRYYRMSMLHDQYWSVTPKMVGRLLGAASYGDSFGGATFPFYKRYFLGGAHTIRGFETDSIGPRVSEDDNDVIGGKFLVRGTAELSRSLDLFGTKDRVSAILFTDVGTVTKDIGSFGFDELRASAGLAVSWLSPIGPLSFIFAKPLRSDDRDSTETFQFILGSL